MVVTRHLDRPIRLPNIADLITQPYGNDNPDDEPAGYKFPNGSIGYQPGPGGQFGHWHNGVDYGVPCGTPIYAPADGEVVLVGLSETGFGLRLTINHGTVWTLYGHLSSIDVAYGAIVKRGQIVAHSGGGNGDRRDGNSTGCHLHWAVSRPDFRRYLDPYPYIQFQAPPASM